MYVCVRVQRAACKGLWDVGKYSGSAVLGRTTERGVMFLSLARRDERYVERGRRAIFRVPGKRVNENFILLTQSAAAVVSYTHARVPPKNVVFVFASLRRRRISCTRTHGGGGEEEKPNKRSISRRRRRPGDCQIPFTAFQCNSVGFRRNPPSHFSARVCINVYI